MWTKRILRAAATVLAAAAATAGVLYLLAIRIPGHYKPMRLSAAEQEDGMRHFVNRVGKFCSAAGPGKPFTWTLTARQANEYLASMDAIAALPGRPLHPSARLAEAGFEDPAVAMRDGVLTIALHSRRHDKILSLDVRFVFNDAGDLTARIDAARIGSLPVPRRLLDEQIRQGRRQLDRRLAAAAAHPDHYIGPIRLGELTAMLRELMKMTNGKYVRPVIISPAGGHRVVVKDIEIRNGRLTLHCRPDDQASSAPTASRKAG